MIFSFDQFKALIESIGDSSYPIVLYFGNSAQPFIIHTELDNTSSDVTFATIDYSKVESIAPYMNQTERTNGTNGHYKKCSFEDAANAIFGCNGWDSKIMQIVLDGVCINNIIML